MLKRNTVKGYDEKFKTNYGKKLIDCGVSRQGKDH